MSENVRDIRCKGCIWESPESGCNVVYSHERCVANRKFVEVEDFDKKKEAFEEGLKRIARCQKILSKDTTISLIGGSVDIPVSMIRIDGIIEIDKLNIIYKILMDEDKDEDKDENEIDYEELELEEMLEDECSRLGLDCRL